MKKLALALMSLSALVFGFGSVAEAQVFGPGGVFIPQGQLVFVRGNQPFFNAFSGCDGLGGIVQFVMRIGPYGSAVSQSSPCRGTTGDVAPAGAIMGFVAQTGPSGYAEASFTTPVAPGAYSGTATQNGVVVGTGSFTVNGDGSVTMPAAGAPAVTTPAGGLPATGSGGMGTTTSIAIGLLLVGLGLFVVAQVRRRQPSVA